jgi:DNA-binding transcriptional LysR family regulator
MKKLVGKSAYRLVASHDCLRFSPNEGDLWSQWSFKIGKTTRDIPVTGRFIANDFASLREAALGDAGIARLPLLLVKEQIHSGRLVSVLDSFATKPNPIHLVHAGGRNLPTKTRAFIDFVHPRLSRMFEPSPTSRH